VLHDLSFIAKRAGEARSYAIFSLMGIAVGLGLLASAIVLALMRGWARNIRNALVEAQLGQKFEEQQRSDFPISHELHALLSEMRMERRFANGIHVEWSPDTLRHLLVEELPATQVLVVSNREPYIHNHVDGAASWRRSSRWCAPVVALGLRMAQAPRIARPWTATIASAFLLRTRPIRCGACG
jgi:trehalose 6-phosphate synthase